MKMLRGEEQQQTSQARFTQDWAGRGEEIFFWERGSGEDGKAVGNRWPFNWGKLLESDGNNGAKEPGAGKEPMAGWVRQDVFSASTGPPKKSTGQHL